MGCPLIPPSCLPHPVVGTEEATAMVNRLLDEQPPSVEAIVAANDDLALGVLLALQARQIRVPGDMAVVGFDNVMNIAG